MKKGVKKKTSEKRIDKKISRFVYWTPRILSILFILFLAMFSLDIFGNGYSFWETVLGLFMHNIPVLLLLIVLIIAWKYEWLGAIAFILTGLIYIIQLLITILRNPPYQWHMLSLSLIIAGPVFLIGILFLINWKQKRKLKK
jgi:hypothetical protein